MLRKIFEFLKKYLPLATLDKYLNPLHYIFPNSIFGKPVEEYTEEIIKTEYGDITVAIKGDRSNPTILTYHDLGLNYTSNFKGFFNVPVSDITDIVQNFCIVHVNAPGQEEGARVLPEDFEYPDMDQLADQAGINIFRENQNYSISDSENFKTFPKSKF